MGRKRIPYICCAKSTLLVSTIVKELSPVGIKTGGRCPPYKTVKEKEQAESKWKNPNSKIQTPNNIEYLKTKRAKERQL
jgi:hypothetical protein